MSEPEKSGGSSVLTTYDALQHCVSVKSAQGKQLAMDCPYTGKGEEFSPTELVEAALAGCMLMSMGALAMRLPTGIGYVTAAKALSTVSMMLAGWGTYWFGRFLLRVRGAAALAALTFLFSPYLLLTLYERGAAAELLGLALMPWTLWAYHRLLTVRGACALLAAAAATALLVLAHNITALFVIPLALLWVTLHAWHAGRWSRLPAAIWK